MQYALILMFAAVANAHFEWDGEKGLEIGTVPGGPVLFTVDSDRAKELGKIANNLGFNTAAKIEDMIFGVAGIGPNAGEKGKIEASIQNGIQNGLNGLSNLMGGGNGRVNLTTGERIPNGLNGMFGLGNNGRVNLTTGGRVPGGLSGFLGSMGQGSNGNNGGKFNWNLDTGKLNVNMGGNGQGRPHFGRPGRGPFGGHGGQGGFRPNRPQGQDNGKIEINVTASPEQEQAAAELQAELQAQLQANAENAANQAAQIGANVDAALSNLSQDAQNAAAQAQANAQNSDASIKITL